VVVVIVIVAAVIVVACRKNDTLPTRGSRATLLSSIATHHLPTAALGTPTSTTDSDTCRVHATTPHARTHVLWRVRITSRGNSTTRDTTTRHDSSSSSSHGRSSVDVATTRPASLSPTDDGIRCCRGNDLCHLHGRHVSLCACPNRSCSAGTRVACARARHSVTAD
jgi:hypothetical protein